MNDTPQQHPPSAPRPLVPLRGRHDLGQIVGFAYRVYARNFAVLFGLALLTVPVRVLQGVIEDRLDGVAQSLAGLLALPEALVGLIASGAIVFAVHEISGGTQPEFMRDLDAAFERIGPLILTTLLAGALAIVAIFAAPLLAVYWLFQSDATIDGKRNWWLAIVPGLLAIYLGVRWVFVPQTVMLEDKRNWAALDRSADLVRGNWWRTLGILFVIGLIQAGPIIIASASGVLSPLLSAAIISAAFALVLPFYAAAQTLLYYDLKSRKDADVISADRIPAAE